MARKPDNSKPSTTPDSYKIRDIEIVHPGVAFEWNPAESLGLKVRTNLTPEFINNRGKDAAFKSDSHVWGWARRITRQLGNEV